MSISYEEALATLEAMFGTPWTRETLDVVLRHFNGHMENTVDSILGHGDQSPQLLLSKLQSSQKVDTSMDEQLARQLSQQTDIGASSSSTTAPSTTMSTTSTIPSSPTTNNRITTGSGSGSGISSSNRRKGIGTFTELPPDFLRVPNYKPIGGVSAADTLDSDEALARMLQDELFTQELANHPDFAHLGRGARGGGGAAGAAAAARGRPQPTGPGLFGRGGGDPSQQQPPPITLPEVMDKISEMGNNARRRLALMAAQFKANTARRQEGMHNVDDGKTYPEMRGLLDDDSDAMELASRKEL